MNLQKSDLLRALQQEIRRHGFNYFVHEPPTIAGAESFEARRLPRRSMAFKLKDRVRRIGQPEICTVEDIRDPDDHILRLNPACETMYWIQLGSDFDTRVWAMESELEAAE